MSEIILCMSCGQPLRNYNEICPRCFPDKGYRMIPKSQELMMLESLEERMLELEKKIDGVISLLKVLTLY